MESAAQLIRELERTRDETLKCFSLSPAELARTYGPGKWPVTFLLHHLSDGPADIPHFKTVVAVSPS